MGRYMVDRSFGALEVCPEALGRNDPSPREISTREQEPILRMSLARRLKLQSPVWSGRALGGWLTGIPIPLTACPSNPGFKLESTKV